MVNDLLTRVKGIFRRLLSKHSPQPSIPEPLPPSEKEKPKVSSSSRSPKASRKKPVRTGKRGNK